VRIGIDAHAIGRRQTGNERFMSGVVAELPGLCDHQVVVYVTDPAAAAELRAAGHTVRVMRPAAAPLRLSLSLPALAVRDRLDVLFVQGILPPLRPCAVVSVVHDVSFARHPEYFAPRQRAWMARALPHAMRHADMVVTVSEFSRREMHEVYGIDPARVVVAYDGVEPRFAAPATVPPPVAPPYLLAVGNLQPRKNLATLVRAFAELRRARPEVRERLVVAGQVGYAGAEVGDLVAAEGLRGQVDLLGYVSDEALVALVGGATAVAYPSVYEGFGLPVVEAMAAGTPVVAGDIPVMREVAGDAALLVPPLDVAAWARTLADLAGDAALRARLQQAGRERAARYTWRACAASVLEALERAAEARRRR